MTDAARERVVTFLYVLMRDHVPTGKVHRIIHEHAELVVEPEFSNPELEQLARRYAARIIEGKVPYGG